VQAAGEDALGVGDGELRAFYSAVAGDGNEARQLESVAEDGNLHERALEEDHSAAGEVGHKRRRVEIGEVIRHENAGATGRDFFLALDLNSNACDPDGNTSDPGADGVEWADVAGEKRKRNEDGR
jgi:hypothetical protein